MFPPITDGFAPFVFNNVLHAVGGELPSGFYVKIKPASYLQFIIPGVQCSAQAEPFTLISRVGRTSDWWNFRQAVGKQFGILGFKSQVGHCRCTLERGTQPEFLQ